MQMNAAAAAAILAFCASSVVAYYPESDYYSLYARDAYPEAEPAEYEDFFELGIRDAESVWDLHPRDAYMEGFETGIYVREAQAPPPGGPTAPSPAQQSGASTSQQGGQQSAQQGGSQGGGPPSASGGSGGSLDPKTLRMQSYQSDQQLIRLQNALIQALFDKIAAEKQTIEFKKQIIQQDKAKLNDLTSQVQSSGAAGGSAPGGGAPGGGAPGGGPPGGAQASAQGGAQGGAQGPTPPAGGPSPGGPPAGPGKIGTAANQQSQGGQQPPPMVRRDADPYFDYYYPEW